MVNIKSFTIADQTVKTCMYIVHMFVSVCACVCVYICVCVFVCVCVCVCVYVCAWSIQLMTQFTQSVVCWSSDHDIHFLVK